MKKLCFAVMLALLLSGCSEHRSDNRKPALEFRNALMQHGGCSYEADITADYGEYAYVFTLDCGYTVGRQADFAVTQPQSISGISGTVTALGHRIEFDGMSLDFGKLANGYVVPLEVPWLLGSCWTEEYISTVGRDGPYTLVTYLHGYDDGEITLETWLDDQGVPVQCDVTYNGTRCLTVRIREFQYKEYIP